MAGDLRMSEGGGGSPILLLLHGLGATGDVRHGRRPLLARLGVPAITLPGLSRNAHVENPELSAVLLDPFLEK
jgi:hypothetical protein